MVPMSSKSSDKIRQSCRWNLFITSPIRYKHSWDHLFSDYSESSHQKKQELFTYTSCAQSAKMIWRKWKEKLKWIYIAQDFPKFFASAFLPTFWFPIQGISVLCCLFICPMSSVIMLCSFPFLSFLILFFCSNLLLLTGFLRTKEHNRGRDMAHYIQSPAISDNLCESWLVQKD